jgi:putative ABC transport system ATP-binding protein
MNQNISAIQPFIRVESLVKTFKRGATMVSALNQVNLDIGEGETVAIMGPSGSGKSTLLHLIGGLDKPDRGTVSVGGVQPSTLGGGAAAWRARTIGIVFQHSLLLPTVNAQRNVELPLLLTRLGRRERERRVGLALELVGIAHRASHLPRELSGGEEQRVAIARAIVGDPQLLICDEPTGSLDQQAGHEISTLLQALGKQLNKTVVIVSHDPQIANYVDRVIRLDKGNLVPPQVQAAAALSTE